MEHRKIGRVVKWRGTFGFIRYNQKDIFVHLDSYLSGFVPEMNQMVEFEIGPATKQGKETEAFRIRVIKTASQVIAEFNERCAGLNASLSAESSGGVQ